MKAVKPPRLVLQSAQPLQVFDPVGQRLDVAEHHRGRAASAQAVPRAADLQPAVGRALAGADLPADAIDEDFRPAAGQRSQPGVLQPLQHLAHRQPGERGDMVDLRRAETVNVDLRKAPLDVAEQLLVPLDFQLGVHARPASKIWLPPRAIVSSILRYSSSRGMT